MEVGTQLAKLQSAVPSRPRDIALAAERPAPNRGRNGKSHLPWVVRAYLTVMDRNLETVEKAFMNKS